MVNFHERSCQRCAKYSFERAEAINPRPGDLVKLTFWDPRGDWAEHMWVQVEETRGAWLRGILRNKPVALPELEFGKIVYGRTHEIQDIIREPPEGRGEKHV